MRCLGCLLLMVSVIFGCGREPSTPKNQPCQMTAEQSQQIGKYLILSDSLSKAGNISASDSVINQVLVQLKSSCNDPYWRYKCHYSLYINAVKDKRTEAVIGAFTQWEQEAATSQDSIRGYYNNVLGYLYLSKGDFEGGRPYLEKAADLIEKSGRTKKLNSVYNNLAPCLIRLGDYQAAKHYLQAALRLNAANKDSNRMAINYLNLGRNYNAYEQSEEAIGCFQQAVALNGEKNAEYFLGMTKAYFKLEDYPNAKLQAIQLLKFSKGEVEYEPVVHAWLGQIADAEKQYKKAISYYQLALAAWIVSADTAHYDFGKTKLYLGEALQSNAQPVKALRCYQDALNCFIPAFNHQDVRKNPTFEQLPNEIWVMEALLDKAKAWEQCFDHSAKKDSLLLINALESAEMATAAFMKMKDLYEEDASKLNLDQYGFAPFYEKAVQLATRLASFTKNKTYLERAFYLTQRSKAGILRNVLQERAVLFTANLPVDSVKKISFLEGKIASIDKQLALEKDSLRTEHLDAERFLLKRQWSKMQRWAKGLLPPPGNPPNLFIADIQSRLANDAILLEYFVGEKQLYTFAVTKNGFEVFQSTISPNFNAAALRFIRSVSDQQWVQDSSVLAEASYLQEGSFLFDYLLSKPLSRFNSIRRLIIVPDGILGRLPFSALLTHPYKGSWRDTNLPVLLQEYAISYLYSSALLQKSDQVKETKYGFGGFGADYRDPLTIPSIHQDAVNGGMPALAARGGLAPLDNADDEVDSLSNLTNGDKWLNIKATKANFLQNGKACGILHFALHTVESPPGDLSGFYLLFSKANQNDDNFLSSNELACLQLHAELAVLSACYSGLGSFQQGEGMMNLGRAFALSGCPSSVVNLWQANDAVSKKIMIDFYKGLKAAIPKDIALQKAQIEYLKQTPSEAATPFFWANFVVMGDVSPLSIAEKEPWWSALVFWD